MRRFSTDFNYYKVLDVPENAESSEIKTAFRTLAKTHHPDKGGDEEHFKKLQEAYVVLMDENTRAHYNAYIAQFKEKYETVTMEVPDWYEPNPYFQSQADEDPDLGELNLWPDADYFQDIIDSDLDRPKTLGWHKREERRRAESDDGKTEYERQQEEFQRMRDEFEKRETRWEREERERKQREAEYERKQREEEEAVAKKMEDNEIAERMYKEKLEQESLKQEKERRERGEQSTFGKFKERFERMINDTKE
jgi:curved DNA-binding protein CbpA